MNERQGEVVSSIYSIEVKTIDGQCTTLAPFINKVLLIVNVASDCGFTPQYQGLENLFQKYQSQGFAVLGFPCNQFGGQEPTDESQIKQFCELNFGVSFPLFSKVEVNGANTHPLFQFLKSKCPGILGTELIKWNFTKFLIDRTGLVSERFAPQATPESLETVIEALLRSGL